MSTQRTHLFVRHSWSHLCSTTDTHAVRRLQTKRQILGNSIGIRQFKRSTFVRIGVPRPSSRTPPLRPSNSLGLVARLILAPAPKGLTGIKSLRLNLYTTIQYK